MTLNQLRYVVAVASARSFHRAASLCFVSQPTISAAIKKLETEIGVELFTRTGNEIGLTSKGAMIVDRARKLLEEADAILSIADLPQDDLLPQMIRLGVFSCISHEDVAKFSDRVQKINETVRLELVDGTDETIFSDLQAGRIDAMLGVGLDELEGVRSVALWADPLCLVLPGEMSASESPNLWRQYVAGAQVAGSRYDLRWLETEVGRQFTELECASSQAALRHVALGHAAALVPRSAIGHVNGASVLSISSGARAIGIGWRCTQERPDWIRELESRHKDLPRASVTDN